MKVREITEIIGISVGAGQNILYEKLEMKRMCVIINYPNISCHAKFPKVEFERTTQRTPRQHYGTIVVVEI